eukprot:m.183005 g.183005  ORF g.183005 m.183005 type:complete len:141 (+) comp17466_c1_seq2:505-927(+)
MMYQPSLASFAPGSSSAAQHVPDVNGTVFQKGGPSSVRSPDRDSGVEDAGNSTDTYSNSSSSNRRITFTITCRSSSIFRALRTCICLLRTSTSTRTSTRIACTPQQHWQQQQRTFDQSRSKAGSCAGGPLYAGAKPRAQS